MVANLFRVELLRQSDSNKSSDNPTRVAEDKLERWFYDCFFIMFTSFNSHASTELDQAIKLCLSSPIWREILFQFLSREAHWHEQKDFFSLCLARLKGGLASITDPRDLCDIMATIFPRPYDDQADLAAGPMSAEQYVESRFLVPEVHQRFEFDLFIQRIRTVDENNSWDPLDAGFMNRIVELSGYPAIQRSSDTSADMDLMRYLLLTSPNSQGVVYIVQLAWGTDSIAAARLRDLYVRQIFLDSVGKECESLLFNIVCWNR